MKFRYLLLAALIAPMMLSAQDVRVVTRIVTDTVPAWKTWKADGFAMNYPGKWTLQEPMQGDTMVVFMQSQLNEGAAAVTVFVQGMEEMPVMKTHGDHANLTPASRENPRAVYDAERNGTPVRVLEQLVAEGGRPFKLTYTAPQAVYDEFLYVAEAMINSFMAVADSR